MLLKSTKNVKMSQKELFNKNLILIRQLYEHAKRIKRELTGKI